MRGGGDGGGASPATTKNHVGGKKEGGYDRTTTIHRQDRWCDAGKRKRPRDNGGNALVERRVIFCRTPLKGNKNGIGIGD